MSKAVLFQVEIPRRARCCAAGDHPFKPEDPYASVLAEDEKGELLRHDYCMPCWEEGAEERWKEAGQSCWRGKVPKKEKRELPPDRTDRALTLLHEALQEGTDAKMAEAFVLALFLARKRVMSLRKQLNRDGQVIQVYEVLATEEMIAVPRHDLKTLPIAGIQRRIAAEMQ